MLACYIHRSLHPEVDNKKLACGYRPCERFLYKKNDRFPDILAKIEEIVNFEKDIMGILSEIYNFLITYLSQII